MSRCEWGSCDSEATEIVLYPGIVAGTAGRVRCVRAEQVEVHLCSSCAAVAREEAAQLLRDHARDCWLCREEV